MHVFDNALKVFTPAYVVDKLDGNVTRFFKDNQFCKVMDFSLECFVFVN